MKRLAATVSSLAIAAGTALTAVVVTAPPAHAAINCRVVEGDFEQFRRVCTGTSSRIGGVVELDAVWDYPASGNRGRDGTVKFQIRDRAPDGCAVVKVKYRDRSRLYPSETVKRKKCNGGTSKVYSFELNKGEVEGVPFGVYDRGVYSVAHCNGGGKDCITIWSQRAADEGPQG